ncbi:MAG: SulP family inorganic anion transporter [Pseudomonadota bacterium]
MSTVEFEEDKKPWLDFSHLRGDIYGGLTVGVVALPLGLAFGANVFPHDEQLGATAGLWGAILVGFFAAAFGGTNTQISGPTGPMVVVFGGLLASLTASLGTEFPNLSETEIISRAIPLLFAAVVLGGLLQIAMGVFKLGNYIKLVPYPVISGFMSGIGVIIILLQAPRVFGGRAEGSGVISAIQAVPDAVANTNVTALGICLLTLVILFFWPKRIGKLLPGTLAALIIGTIVGVFFPGAPLLGEIKAGVPEFLLPAFSGDTIILVFEAAIVLAVLGAVDSLLTSLVADNVTRTRHNSDQELIGQGIGNTVAGFFGALPGAGATMRTMVNIKTGGVTKLSGMIHGATLAAIVLVAAPLAAMIPNAVLAGVLIKVGYDIIDFQYLRHGVKGPKWDLFLMLLVLGLTVFVDLITAVGVGVFLAALAYVKLVADDQIKAVNDTAFLDTTAEEDALLKEADGAVMLYNFGAPLSFGAAADLGHHVRQRVKKGAAAIVLDFSRMTFVDVSAARAVETIASDAEAAGKTIYICGMNADVRAKLSGLNADELLPNDTSFDDRLSALKAAVKSVKGKSGEQSSSMDDPTLATAE